MNTKDTFALSTAGITLAAAAPAIAVGAAIGLGLLWLFGNDDKPHTATATPGNEPPVPDAPRKSSGWFFFDDEPKTDAPAVAKIAVPQLHDEEAGLARARAKLRQLEREQRADLERLKAMETRLARSRTAHNPSPPAVTLPAAPSPAMAPRPVAAPVVTVKRDTVTAAAPVASPALAPIIAQSPAPPTATRTAKLETRTAPGRRHNLAPRKYDRAHLEAVLRAGPLSRKAVVDALRAAPFNYSNTLAYVTLQRFADALDETPEGLLAWKPAQG